MRLWDLWMWEGPQHLKSSKWHDLCSSVLSHCKLFSSSLSAVPVKLLPAFFCLQVPKAHTLWIANFEFIFPQIIGLHFSSLNLVLLFPAHILPQARGSHTSGDCTLQKQKEWSHENFCVCECIRHRRGVGMHDGKKSKIYVSSQKSNQDLARSKGGREQGRKESLVKCSVFVLWWEVSPPTNSLFTTSFLSWWHCFNPWSINQKNCHEVDSSCSGSVLLHMNSEAGP